MSTHYPGTAHEKLVLDTWIKVTRAKETIETELRRLVESHGITMTQFGFLEILQHLGPLTLKEVGEKILLSSSNLVTVADNLCRDGLIQRKPHPSDRRSKIISLTAKGKALIEPLFRTHLDDLVQRFGGLNASEMASLGALMKKIGLYQNTLNKE